MSQSLTGMIGRVSLRRVLRLSVGILSSSLVAAQPVLAQVASAPGGPEISSAPNGIEMVLIQTPNGQGVSHNQYDAFNVGPDGLILNNIAQPFGQTHLAGIVEGNANLAGGAAQIILNEVVGANPSSLTGYLEVGGTRADVIVANPYGMTCDGCGFLNTDRLTLSTGAPQFDAGTFTGLSVDDGEIAIGTNGLDALDTTRFDLIARRITVAGSVHGQRINVIAGRNDVIYATGEITERPDDGSPAPDLAIDSTVLGGMYAGALSITSTEDGVGVRAPQQMAATTGEMVLTADGRLVIGQASAAGAVAVESTQGSVEVEEVLVAGGDLSLTSAEDLIAAADARIVSGAAALFDVGRDLQAGAASEIAAGSSVAMSVAQDAVFGDGARVLSYGDVSINAERITGGAETVFLAGAAGGEGDTSQTTLSLGASETIILAGLAGSAGDISVVAQVLDIAADGALPAGRFVAGGTAQFQLTRLEALEGSLEAGARLELENAGGILEIEGGILQAGEDVTLAGEGIVVSGIVQSLGGAVVAAATAGDLIATGTLAGGSVDLHAAGLLETTGTVQGMGSVALSGIELVNSGVISGWDVSLTGDVITNDGTAYGMAALSLFSGGDVTNMGALLSDGWLVIAGEAEGPNPALSNAADAEIRAAGDVVLELAGLDNAGAVAATGGQLLITSAGDVINQQTGVLYGQMRVQLLSDAAIVNDGGAILAEGDLIVGGINSTHAGRFTNQNGGLVETFTGDVQIAATIFENLRDMEIAEEVEQTQTSIRTGKCSGWERHCLTTTTTTTVTTEVATLIGLPAQIISGGDMRLSGDSGLNAYSLISATGDLDLDFVSLTNEGRDLTETTEVVYDYHLHRRNCPWVCTRHNRYWSEIEEPVVVEAGAVFATIEAGGVITGAVTGYLQNGAVADGVIPTVGTGAAPVAGLPIPDTLALDPLGADLSEIAADAVGNPALIVVNPDPDADYLVETRYEFIDLSHFINSSDFLANIGYDADAFGKRLGDAYVETQFLRAQLFALTGQRLLEPGIDERAQMQALYDNAIDAAQTLDLAVGVALSPAQIAALTQDIIWLEEIVVDGQTVLAPRLYLANPETLAGVAGATGSEAARIDAADITLIAGAFVNSGAVTAADNLYLATLGDMDLYGGQLAAGATLSLDVAGTLNSVSSTIAGQDVSLAAREIQIATATVTAGSGENFTEGAARTSTILAGDTLVMQAMDDITLTGAALATGGDMTLAAGGQITAGALALEHQTDRTYAGGYSLSEGTTHLTSQLTAGGDMMLHAVGSAGTGGDIVLEGAQLAADGGMVLLAERGHVRLEAVADHFYNDITSSSNGLFSSSSSRDQEFHLTHQVASLSAGAGIEVMAAGSILVEGTQFDVGGDLMLVAGAGDIRFTAPTNIHAESHFYESSFLGGLAGSTSDIRMLTTQSLGSVATVAGDINLSAGGDLVLTAVDFQAGGDIRTHVAGETHLLAAVDVDYRSVAEMDNNMIVITTLNSEDYTERATFNSLEAGGAVLFDDASPITLDAVRDPLSGMSHAGGLLADGEAGMALAATYLGRTDPATGPPQEGSQPNDWRADLTLIAAALPTGADGAGYLYLDDVTTRDSTTINAVMLVDEHFYEQTTQLSPAFKALITIVITQGVGGFGGLAGGLGEALGLTVTAANGTVSLTALGTAVNAFTANAIVGVIDGAVSGNMDLSDILGDAVFAGVTAGLTAGIDLNSTFGIEFGEGATTGLLGMGNNLSVANILERGLDNLISSGLSAAVYDTNFGDSFASAMTSSLVNLAMADVQYAIGEIGVTRNANGRVTHNPNWEGSPGHAILHGLAGCAAAELQGADCAAGAAGAVAQSLYAGTLSAPNREHYASDEDHAEAYAAWERTTLNTAELIGGTVGFLFSEGQAQNVSIAANVAQSGLNNNYLAHDEESRRRELRAFIEENCPGAAECEAYLDEVRALNALDEARNEALQVCDSGLASAECQIQLASLQLTFQSYAEAREDGTFNPQTVGEFAEVGILYGDYQRHLLWAATSQALLEIPLETAQGILEMDWLLISAYYGNSESQQQLVEIGLGMLAFAQDPDGVIEQAVAEQLAEADRLEAAGDFAGAAEIHGELAAVMVEIIVGIVTGGVGISQNAARRIGQIAPNRGLDGWEPPAGYTRNADGTVTSSDGQVYTPVRDADGNIRTNSNGDPIFNTQSGGTTAQTTLTNPSASGSTINVPATGGGQITPRTVGNLQGGPLENATQRSGRFQNSGGPANGVVYRADNQGNVTAYATYDANGNITSRVDLDPNSAPHFDRATGQYINPPHVVEYPINPYNGRSQTNQGVTRPANPEDIP